MKIIDYKHHSWDNKNIHELDKLVMLEMDDNAVDIRTTINHNNKNYCVQIIDFGRNIAYAREFEFKEEFDETYNYDDFECPYCGDKMSDSWESEMNTEFDIVCDNCGKTYTAYAETSITYKAIPKEDS